MRAARCRRHTLIGRRLPIAPNFRPGPTLRAKYLVFQLAEVAVPRPVFAAIVKRIGRLRLACASG